MAGRHSGLGSFLRRYRLASIGATALVLFLTLLPGKDLPETNLVGLDKLLHLLMFGAWSLALRFDARRAPGLLLFGAAFLLGAGTELLQGLVPGRSTDMLDLAFDLLGAALALRFDRHFIESVDKLLRGDRAAGKPRGGQGAEE